MELIFTPNPGYIHKVIVVAIEAGVRDRIDFIDISPMAEGSRIWDYNPLGKTPCLRLDDGQMLYGGLVICEYIDAMSPKRRLFPQDDSRWLALRLMTLGDGVFDATTLLRVENRRPEDVRNGSYVVRHRQKIIGGVDQMEKDAKTFGADDFHIGHVCFAGALSYLDWGNPISGTPSQPGDESYDWRTGHPALEAWYENVRRRPSMAHGFGR